MGNSPTGNRTQTKRVKTAHPNHWTIGDDYLPHEGLLRFPLYD